MNIQLSYQTTKCSMNYQSKDILLPILQIPYKLVSKSNSFNSEFEHKPMSSCQFGIKFTNNLEIGKSSILKSKQFQLRSSISYRIIPVPIWMFCWFLLLTIIYFNHEDKNYSYR